MERIRIEDEKIILVALAKLFSEQSTYVIGELKQQQKFRFKVAVSAVDAFVNEIESKLSETSMKTLELITDALHGGMTGLRNDLK